MMDEQTIGMWQQWMIERAGKDFKPAIEELCWLAVQGIRLSKTPPKLSKTKRKVYK